MRTGVKTTQQKKKRQEAAAVEQTQRAAAPPDTIKDPLRAAVSDPLKTESLKDAIVEQTHRIRRRKKKRDEEEEELGVPHEEAAEILEDLRVNSDLSDEELDLEALIEEDLEVEQVVELFEIDELGQLMNELADLDALDEESPIVEALIQEELEKATDATLNGFANIYVTAEDMIDNEIQSQMRPFDDADTRMQVTPMSWVPNRIKEPIGRRAMDEPLVDRGLNHMVKQDTATRDEDNDIGVRTRRRWTPAIPTADTITSGLGESKNQIGLRDLTTIFQTYHETMQANPDLGKTFLLGAIRMMGTFVESEQPRLDLPEGKTPIEWMLNVLMPSVIDDMSYLELFFDREVDMLFYRQWKSIAMRVVRTAKEKIKEQTELRKARDDDQAMTDMLDAVPEGELLTWSAQHPDDALTLFEDEDHKDDYVDRLMSELFGNEAVKGFLDLADTFEELLLPQEEDEEPDEKLIMLQEAFLEMDLTRLEELRHLEEMEELAALIDQSLSAISALDPMMRGIVMSMMHLYGTSGAGLEEIARGNPTHTVLTVTRGPQVRPIPQAVLRPEEPNTVPHHANTDLGEAEEEEDDDDAPSDEDGDEGDDGGEDDS